MELSTLQKSGTKKKLFTAHYNMGDEFIFVLGGKDSCNLQIVNTCKKFNVNSLKWEPMPNMNHARAAAGSYMSQDRKSLFAFGGSHDSVERLSLTKYGEWETINMELPQTIAFKGGLTMLPMWHYSQQLQNIEEDKVLIFGGGLKEVFAFDHTAKTVLEVEEGGEDNLSNGSPRSSGSSGSPKSSSSKKLQINRDDWFIAQPVIHGQNLVLMGLNHIYFMDLVNSKTQIRKHIGRNYI
tara:strand:+ start:495 stop:1208 length:714 start_codon:yes stop_codon:yes gene_type:complete